MSKMQKIKFGLKVLKGRHVIAMGFNPGMECISIAPNSVAIIGEVVSRVGEVISSLATHLLLPKSRGRLLSLLPLTSVNGKETASVTTGLQPHTMWLKPLTFMKSANRQLKQTAIKQTACPDFSGTIKHTIGGNKTDEPRMINCIIKI